MYRGHFEGQRVLTLSWTCMGSFFCWPSNPIHKAPENPDPIQSSQWMDSIHMQLCGNSVPIVKAFKNALWTALQTIFRPKNAQDCRILHINLNFLGVTPRTLSAGGGDPFRILPSRVKCPRCLDPDTNFPLARKRFHCSCLTKRPQVH